MSDQPIRVVKETGGADPDVSWSKIVATTERTLGHSIEPFSVVFVSRSKIRKLNRRYRNIDKATNILSFPDGREILIVLDIVREEARKQERNSTDWLVQLVVHGILHLEGYTHKEDVLADEMEKFEEKILKTYRETS